MRRIFLLSINPACIGYYIYYFKEPKTKYFSFIRLKRIAKGILNEPILRGSFMNINHYNSAPFCRNNAYNFAGYAIEILVQVFTTWNFVFEVKGKFVTALFFKVEIYKKKFTGTQLNIGFKLGRII